MVTVVSGKGVEMDCSFVKDTFMEATDFVVKRALEGLNDSTLGDPKRRIMLESVSQTLPTQVPEVAKVQAMLVGLIDLSADSWRLARLSSQRNPREMSMLLLKQSLRLSLAMRFPMP